MAVGDARADVVALDDVVVAAGDAEVLEQVRTGDHVALAGERPTDGVAVRAVQDRCRPGRTRRRTALPAASVPMKLHSNELPECEVSTKTP